MDTETSERLHNLPYSFDDVGRILVEENRVLRVVNDPIYIKLYRDVIKSAAFNTLVTKGLIKTKIVKDDDLNSILILEHKKLDFVLSPAEYTNLMFWEATHMYVKLSIELYNNYGILTKDAHPWNITFSGNKPIFFDFSSLYKGNTITNHWFKEFEKYFATAIYLASYSKWTYPMSLEYRREHLTGIGTYIFSKKLFKNFWNRKYLNP